MKILEISERKVRTRIEGLANLNANVCANELGPEIMRKLVGLQTLSVAEIVTMNAIFR
jgi:hypothetical protein